MNPNVAVASAGFQEQHAMAAGSGETVGQNAAGRAGADDDIVESRIRRACAKAMISRADFRPRRRGAAAHVNAPRFQAGF